MNRHWKKSAAAAALFLIGAAALALPGERIGRRHQGGTRVARPEVERLRAQQRQSVVPVPEGMRWVSTGVKDGKKSVDHYVVTQKTKDIQGVAATVVRDTLTQKGKIVEGTWDWYAQDKQGNVWYLGERTREYNAARAGDQQIRQLAGRCQGCTPLASSCRRIPGSARGVIQEYWPGHALDKYRIMNLTASVTVPYGTFTHNTIRTRETTALEPGIVDGKNYAKGIGQVAEQTVKGPKETSFLVTFKQ